MANMGSLLLFVLFCFFNFPVLKGFEKQKDWKNKEVREYDDNDFEMLYEEWEKNDEEKIPADELPYGHPDRPFQKTFKLEDINPKDPESIKRASKLNKNIIVVATLTGNPTREETEDISRIWQMGLYNNHIDLHRFILDDDRVMFSAVEGDVAFDVKDYLIDQERVDFVEMDQDVYYGKFSSQKHEL